MAIVTKMMELMVKIAMWLTEQSFKLLFMVLQMVWNGLVSIINSWNAKPSAKSQPRRGNRRKRNPRGWGRKWQRHQR